MYSIRTLIVAALLAAVGTTAGAQTADTLKTASAWTKGLVGSVSLTQAAYDNWKAGGENTVAFKVALDGKAERTAGRVRQTHSAQFAYGKSRVGDQGVRKIDDLLRYNLALAFLVNGPVSPVLGVDARTQVDDGFNYGTDPNTLIARFLSPAYIVESIGVGYEPAPWIKLRLGAASKQTVVTEETLRAGYGLDPDEQVRGEIGANFGALLEKEVVQNVFLKSELDIFEAFTDASHPDVRLKNLVQMKVNAYLNVNLEAEIYYDNDASTDLQVRQTLGLGIGLTLI